MLLVEGLLSLLPLLFCPGDFSSLEARSCLVSAMMLESSSKPGSGDGEPSSASRLGDMIYNRAPVELGVTPREAAKERRGVHVAPAGLRLFCLEAARAPCQSLSGAALRNGPRRYRSRVHWRGTTMPQLLLHHARRLLRQWSAAGVPGGPPNAADLERDAVRCGSLAGAATGQAHWTTRQAGCLASSLVRRSLVWEVEVEVSRRAGSWSSVLTPHAVPWATAHKRDERNVGEGWRRVGDGR